MCPGISNSMTTASGTSCRAALSLTLRAQLNKIWRTITGSPLSLTLAISPTNPIPKALTFITKEIYSSHNAILRIFKSSIRIFSSLLRTSLYSPNPLPWKISQPDKNHPYRLNPKLQITSINLLWIKYQTSKKAPRKVNRQRWMSFCSITAKTKNKRRAKN